jgi:small-conductance mechanosensitive channel
MIVKEWAHELMQLVTKKHLFSLATAAIVLLVGFFLARRARQTISNMRTLDIQKKMLFEKVAYFGLVLLSIAAALDSLGFDLKVLLGAAGILTVAVGFAAQTSASNLISGLFLMFERPFVVGNSVIIGDLRGEVVAIDMLSTKIRTFTNMMVRIPNETLVKSNIVNLSYFPIRRVDLEIGVAYASDLDQVEAVVRETIAGHPRVLRNPEPQFLMKAFGASSIDFDLHVWTETDNAPTIKSELYRALNSAFRDNKVEIPFPTRVLIQAPPPSHS